MGRTSSVASTAGSSARSHRTARSAAPDKGSRTTRTLTCANCRIRKTRCDGSQPGCKTCEVYNDECRYEKPPPMSQIVAMAKKIQDMEQTNQELRDALHAATTPKPTPQSSFIDGTGSDDSPATFHAPSEVAASTSVGFLDRTESEEEGSTTQPETTTTTDASSVSEERLLSDLSLDENGKLCYYGPTSAVYEPALDAQSTDSPNYDEQSSKSDARNLLTNNALESRAWEAFALGNAEIQTDIPRNIISRLLQIHWAWISPGFNWVYRPAFMRDMALDGPCYSPFLLTVMCAHAARFDQGKTSEVLISRARLLLGHEIHRPSSIPTVQALLQLSARDLAFGQISQAWIYSGLAFRMASDLGLHQSTARMAMLGHLSAEDVEIRRRLFWSCYFWDKAISLYLGRMPVLPELPFDKAPEFLDDSAENDIWSPFFGDTINLSRMAFGEYPIMKGHVVSCFQNSCKLSVILNDIIFHLYSKRGNANGHETLKDIRSRLDSWRRNSPSHLKYDPDCLPDVCPPPHILTQNLLYYTTVILLHRPFYSNPAHHAACRTASDAIEKLVLLLEKTFGFSRITYIMAYCIYTGASVMMQDVKTGDMDANIKMQTFLHALRQGINTCPIVQRSLDIITGGLRSDALHAAGGRVAVDSNTTSESSVMARNYLPAFPYRNLDLDIGADPNAPTMDLDGFSMLDCFPENHLEGINMPGVHDWFMPSA